MPQAASITVNDRESTPVAHTFAPRRVETGMATFVEAGTVPIGERTLVIRWRKSGSRFYLKLTLSAPTLVTETINGVAVPTVPRVGWGEANFRFDDTSTLQERKNVIGMFANCFASSQTVVDGVLTQLEGIW